MVLPLHGAAAPRLKRKFYEKEAKRKAEAKLSAGVGRESLIEDMKSSMEAVEQTFFDLSARKFITPETIEQIAVMRGQSPEELRNEWFVNGTALLYLKAIPNDENYGWAAFAAVGNGNFQCAMR